MKFSLKQDVVDLFLVSFLSRGLKLASVFVTTLPKASLESSTAVVGASTTFFKIPTALSRTDILFQSTSSFVLFVGVPARDSFSVNLIFIVSKPFVALWTMIRNFNILYHFQEEW